MQKFYIWTKHPYCRRRTMVCLASSEAEAAQKLVCCAIADFAIHRLGPHILVGERGFKRSTAAYPTRNVFAMLGAAETIYDPIMEGTA